MYVCCVSLHSRVDHFEFRVFEGGFVLSTYIIIICITPSMTSIMICVKYLLKYGINLCVYCCINTILSCFSGYHEYMHVWDAVVGEILPRNNEARKFA